MLLGVRDETVPNAEPAPGKGYLRLPLLADFLERAAEVVEDVANVGWCADGNDGARLGNIVGAGQERRTTQGVPDENGRSSEMFPQMSGGVHQIFDVRGEVGVGKLPFRRPQPGEVEAQDSDASRRQARCNTLGSDHVLRACEAVRKQREGAHRAGRQVDTSAELETLTSLERRTDNGRVWPRRHHALLIRSDSARRPNQKGVVRTAARPVAPRHSL